VGGYASHSIKVEICTVLLMFAPAACKLLLARPHIV